MFLCETVIFRRQQRWQLQLLLLITHGDLQLQRVTGVKDLLQLLHRLYQDAEAAYLWHIAQKLVRHLIGKVIIKSNVKIILL